MEIKSAIMHAAKLPLKKPFKHASFTRDSNDTTFLELSDGSYTGWGEALPREYVSGETPQKVEDNLVRYASAMRGSSFKDIKEISQFLKELEPDDSRNMASLCALDMALLDLYGKNLGKSISDLLGGNNDDVRVTSGPMGMTTPKWKKDFYVFVGVSDIKYKINRDSAGRN